MSTATIGIDDVKALIGRPFPGGSFTVEPYKHFLTCDVVLAPEPADGTAHPIFVYMAAIAGFGLSIDELFELCLASPADGAVFGECELEIHTPLRVGATYSVTGRIGDVARKEGKRAGVFDIVRADFEVLDRSGAVVATSRKSFVFPRR